jgi:hypothetical protein
MFKKSTYIFITQVRILPNSDLGAYFLFTWNLVPHKSVFFNQNATKITRSDSGLVYHPIHTKNFGFPSLLCFSGLPQAILLFLSSLHILVQLSTKLYRTNPIAINNSHEETSFNGKTVPQHF